MAKTKTSWKQGQSGNPNGRPPTPEIDILRQAIATVEARRKKKFFIMVVERAYESDTVLIAILKKILPDLRHNEHDHKTNESTMAMVVQTVQRLKNAKSN